MVPSLVKGQISLASSSIFSASEFYSNGRDHNSMDPATLSGHFCTALSDNNIFAFLFLHLAILSSNNDISEFMKQME